MYFRPLWTDKLSGRGLCLKKRGVKMTKKCEKGYQNIILFVTGGIGRNIMATAVVRNLKKAYPGKDIIVLAGCPEIFLKNPNVKRVLNFGQPLFFYEDYILKSKSLILSNEPYQSYDYIYKRKHFVECWCDQIGIPCDNPYPEIYFTDAEMRMAKLYLEKFDREMVLIQHCGGKAPPDKTEKEKIINKAGMYKRNLPEDMVTALVDGLIERGFMVGAVQQENQFLPAKAEKIMFPIRAVLALIPYVAEVIAIDSFLQHGTAIFKKKSLILWGGTNPKVLGYNSNVNLTKSVCDNPMCHRPNSYLFDFEPTGFMWDCSHNDKCMEYTAEEILKSFDEMTGGRHGRKKERGQKSIDSAPGEAAEKAERAETDGCPVGAGLSAGGGQNCPHR